MEQKEKLIDITQTIKKPADFNELLALANHYKNMETIIDCLNKPNSCLFINEDLDDDDAEIYSLDHEYSVLLINVLQAKMKEIRNVLNFN